MQQKFSHSFKIIALLLVSINCDAQKFEWVNFYQGLGKQYPVSMSADSLGNQYATFYFDYQFKFNSVYLKYTSTNRKGLVLKQNTDGKILWYKTIESVNTAYNVEPAASMFNSKGNLIVFVGCMTNIKIGADTIKRNGSSGWAYYLVEFDDTGKIVKSKHIIESSNLAIIINHPSSKFICEKNDNISMALYCSGLVTVYDSAGTTNVGSTSSKSRNIIFKFANCGNNLKWTNILPGDDPINCLKTDIYGNVYVATYWSAGGSSTPIVFKGKTLTKPWANVGTVFIWDKNGKDRNWFYIEPSSYFSNIYNLAVYDSSSIYISGCYFGDSVKVDTVWKKNKQFGSYLFIACYHENGIAKWFKAEDTTYGTNNERFNIYTSMTLYNDKFIYTSFYLPGYFNKPFILDGQKYYPTKRMGLSLGMNMKVDERGNVLWGFRTAYPFSSMATDEKDNLFFQGTWYQDSIFFGSFKAAINSSYDAYIGKMTDYAIERGNVYAGPYCAGDTIRVPFTKKGDFDTSNFFIAELSDEFGNFEGKERELGRVKSTKDTVIIGKLPLFKIASSGKYRIRIISTNPIVQSFYKFDKLRLLIYSSDKADPGPTETICYGDSIQLSTYGGTKWKWSPKYNMNDSTLRQPRVWPDKTTTYKIIIADSSGCGAPDTAYKKIVVRKPLKLTLAFNDTSVCDTSLLIIPMHFDGGDSTNYHWQAWSVSSTKVWQKTKSGKLKLNDTLFHLPKITIITSQKLAIVLDDECTNKKDTAYVIIQLQNPSVLSTKFKDTFICMGNIISWKAKPVYSLSKNSVWEWRDITNNKVLSTSDSLMLTARGNTIIKLTLTNGCTIDSNVFIVNVNPPLRANILSGKGTLNDTTLCLGQMLNLFTKGNGGMGKGYQYSWKVNGNIVSMADWIFLKPIIASNLVLTLVLNDNCTIPSDSVSKIVTVVESPKANFSYGVVCNRANTDFKFTGTKPKSPVTTSFRWNFNNEDSSAIENPVYKFSSAGTKKITLTLTSNNGCIKELTKQIIIKVQSKADFVVKDVCENDSAVFINKSKDATSYNWEFGDGATTNLHSAKHKYQNGINPKTYSVKLIAIVKDGCSDSITKTISIFESPKADFSYSKVCYLANTDFKFTGIKPKSPVTSFFNWNFNNEDSSIVENPSYLFSGPGNKIITVSLTSTNGCTDTLTQKIVIKPKANADFIANDVCETDSVVFKNVSKDATGYKWKFGDGNISNIESPKHIYDIGGVSKTFNVSLVAIVANGCSDSITKAISINANPVSDFSFIINQSKVDFKANQSGNTNYNWKFGNGDSATTSNKDYSYTYPKLTGKYTACLKTINAANCFSETCQKISITVGVSTISKPTGFKIYPNPNTGSFTVEINKPTNEVSIEVYDILGNLIKTVETIPSKISYSIEMNVAEGIYLVKVKNGAEVWTEKVSVGGDTNR